MFDAACGTKTIDPKVYQNCNFWTNRTVAYLSLQYVCAKLATYRQWRPNTVLLNGANFTYDRWVSLKRVSSSTYRETNELRNFKLILIKNEFFKEIFDITLVCESIVCHKHHRRLQGIAYKKDLENKHFAFY